MLFRGRVRFVSYLSIVIVFVIQAILIASEGTSLAPATTLFSLLVIIAGLFFNAAGIVIATITSSLLVAGLILAQHAGILPPPHYEESTFQWFVFSITFGVTGGLTYYSQRLTQKALTLAENEVLERKRTEVELRKLTQAVEQSPASIVITGLDGNIEYVNQRFSQVTGYTYQEALGKNPRILKTDRTPPETYPQLWQTITQGNEWHGEFMNRKKDGSFYCESATISPITNLNGVTTHYLAVKEDITKRKQVENTLRENEERFRRMFEDHDAVMLLIDPHTGQLLDANHSAARFYGYSRATLKTMFIDEIIVLSPDEIKIEMQKAERGALNHFVFPHKLCNGDIRIVEVHSSSLTIQGKDALFSIVHDITQRKRLEQALLTSEARLRALFDQTHDAVFLLDLNGKFLSANQRASTMFDIPMEDLRNNVISDVTNIQKYLTRMLSGEEIPVYEIIFQKKDGQILPAEMSMELVRDDDGKPMHIQALVRDISARKQVEDKLKTANEQLQLRVTEVESLQQELREQAIHDPLTGLYNRRYLNETIEREIARANRENDVFSIIISDIDHFKMINDTYGHQVGDTILVEIARIQEKHTRGSDIACRYGGEEFLLVLPGTKLDFAIKRAEEIRQKCADTILQQGENVLNVTMSFGVATYPDHGQEADEIIIKADSAMYKSKQTGRNKVTGWISY